MLFGNANRWQGALDTVPDNNPFDPRAIWTLWETFGISTATMHGWWLNRERGAGTVPVRTSNASVLVTAYVHHGNATLLALASFLRVDVSVTLVIDWTALGLAASKVRRTLHCWYTGVAPRNTTRDTTHG